MGIIVYSLRYINLVKARSKLHISAFYLNKEESIQSLPPPIANSTLLESVLPVFDGSIAKTALQMFCWVLLLGDGQENFAIPAESFFFF